MQLLLPSLALCLVNIADFSILLCPLTTWSCGANHSLIRSSFLLVQRFAKLLPQLAVPVLFIPHYPSFLNVTYFRDFPHPAANVDVKTD